MSKRSTLPYSTQDLFPQAPSAASPGIARNHSTANSIAESIDSASYPQTGTRTRTNLGTRFRHLRVMAKRLFKPTTLDFETAVWEIFHLIINPRKMYRSHYYYKQQTTNGGKFSYTRDDPSFLILLTAFLGISAVAWGLAYSPTVSDILRLIVYMVLIDFYLTGFVIATVSWFVTNKLFNSSFAVWGGTWKLGRSNINYVEWGFCFDIHCNSFLVIWCLLYMVQFLLLPVLRLNSVFALVLGNSLYFGSIGYYFVISLYGFSSLPLNPVSTGGSKRSDPVLFLQMIVLAGILPTLAVLWLLSVGFGFNVARTMVDTYFN